MRVSALCLFLVSAVFLPRVGTAQVYSFVTPPPQVTAASSSWQILGEPIFYAGGFYDPSGPSVYFDGNVMRRTGVYFGVPLYEDSTLPAYSKVFVPIGGAVMRPYERRDIREGVGPAYGLPWPSAQPETLAMQAASAAPQPLVAPETYELIATSGRLVLRPVGVAGAVPPDPPAPTIIESIPPPATNEGVWIEYEGARWYLSGMAALYEAERFTPVGSYRGFPVYQETGAAASNTIYVSVVQDGPVAPYRRK